MTFIVNGEILAGTCRSLDSGTIKIFYLPSSENYKYVVRAVSEVHTGVPSISCEAADGTIVENWSIYPPKETEEIHYLDPKYIEDMYYTEKGPIIEELGNTYEDWLKLVDGETTDMDKKVLSFLYDGKLYENVKPTYASFASAVIYTFGSSSSDTVVIQYTTKTISASKPFFFVKIISKDDVVHKIPEKYYDSGAPFVITITTINHDGTCEIDRTWDEIKEEFSKNTLPNHYIIINLMSPFPIEVAVCDKTVSSDEITRISFGGQLTNSDIQGSVSDPSNGILTTLYEKKCQLSITSTKTTFNFITGEANLIYNVTRLLNKNSNGEIYSDNRIFSVLQNLNKDDLFMNSLARVTYNNEHYYFESAQLSNNDITAFFFSTTASGIYRRLKVTPGETEQSDNIITVDKEIPLENIMVVKISGNGTTSSPYTSDKTYGEIIAAYSNDIHVFVILDNTKSQYPLISYDSNYVFFGGLVDSVHTRRIRISKNNEITIYTNTLETPGNRVSKITDENSQTVTNYPNVAAVKSYVDEKVQGVISFDSLIVDELPETGVKGVVYFVPHTHLWSNDSYDEYMWTGEKFEKIGNTDIDLTNYVKKDELPTSLKNPNALTIKVGDKTYIYDGSEAITIEIPDGTEVSY